MGAVGGIGFSSGSVDDDRPPRTHVVCIRLRGENVTTFKCPHGHLFSLPTRKRRFREKGHVKTMWCWRCKRTVPFRMVG